MEVSVIITTKNRKSFLIRAINSILSQSVLPSEILVIDDGSDNIHLLSKEEILYFSKYIKFIYIKNQCSLGGNYSRNLGIDRTSSPIIMFLDDDDFWLSTKIEKQILIFSQTKSIGLVYTGTRFVKSNNLECVIRKSNESHKPKSIWHGNYPGSTSGVAIRRECIERSGAFDIKLESLQDYDLWIRIINNYDVSWDGEFNLIYTIHSNNINQVSKNVDKHLNSISYIKRKYANEINDLTFVEKRKFLSRIDHLVARAYRRNGNILFFKYYLRSLFLFPSLRTLVLPFYFK